MVNNSELYTNDFYQANYDINMSGIAPIINDIVTWFQPNSAVDLGCGLGIWLHHLKNAGIKKVLGVDGSHINKKLSLLNDSEFMEFDLTKKIKLDQRFDIALSLEVAEHLEDCYAKTFVESLTNLSDIILFSAAIPKQGGDHHVNEQWTSYWNSLFAMKGYKPINCIRGSYWNVKSIQTCYRQNLLIYINHKQQILFDKMKVIEKGTTAIYDLVHPEIYMKQRMNFEIIDKLLTIYEKLNNQQHYVHKDVSKTIALYGGGLVGKHIYQLACLLGLNVLYVIDQYTNIDFYGLKIYHLEDTDRPDVDEIIITSPYHEEELRLKMLHIQINCEIVPIKNFFESLE